MEMRAWVLAKLLWDPARNVRELVQDFIWGYYGAAAPAIAEYNELLQRTAQQPDAFRSCLYRYPMNVKFLSQEFGEKATGIFERAAKLAENKKILRRVQLAALPVTYVKLSRGPEFVGEGYGAMLDEFEATVRGEGIAWLSDKAWGNVDQQVAQWRGDWWNYDGVPEISAEEIRIWPVSNVWKFATDPDNLGVADKWYATSFDDGNWAEVRSDQGNGWEKQGFADYVGYGWYRQSLELPADLKRKHLYLYFGAVDEQAWVYINGQPVFEHTMQSTGRGLGDLWRAPFLFDVRDHLKLGQANTLVVRVHNMGGQGGVWKPVHVVASDRPLALVLVTPLVE